MKYAVPMVKKPPARDIPVILWILLAVIIITSSAVLLPGIIGNIRSYESLLIDTPRAAESAGIQPILRALTIYRDDQLHAEVTGIPVYGSSSSRTLYDRLITGILRAPTIDELEKGYLSMIPPGTKYIGSRRIRRTVYIEFSKEFYSAHPLGEDGRKAATDQITATLKGIEGVSAFLLIHGDEVMEGPIPVR